MDALDVILKRRVTRNFKGDPVSDHKLIQIVEAGRHAMSARNLQPWQFVIVRDRDKLNQLGALCSTGRFIAEAPAAVAVLKDLSNKRWADVDCAQAVQNMANAAWAFGLGTCWVGNFDAEKVALLLGVPSGWAVFTVLPFGIPDPGRPPQNRPLKKRSENVYFERYGQQQE